MAAVEVIVVDKAVSTEDLGVVNRDIHLEVARLEAMLNTLVENKVESMKADKEKEKEKEREKEKNSKHRITSTSTNTSSGHGQHGRRHRHHHKSHSHRHDASPRRKRHKTCCDHELGEAVDVPVHVTVSEEEDELMDEAFDFLTYQDEHEPAYPCACPCPCNCSCPTVCQDNHHGQIMKLPYDDFISISMDVDPDLEDSAVMLDEVEHRRRRRRRRRRKRRRRQRLAAAAAVSAAAAAQARRDARKVMDTDDLPQRARWTIVVTACLLLFLCLLLVGVTLRMAPIIDDMVRKENEELLNSLNRESGSWNHTTTTTPAPAVAALGTGK